MASAGAAKEGILITPLTWEELTTATKDSSTFGYNITPVFRDGSSAVLPQFDTSHSLLHACGSGWSLNPGVADDQLDHIISAECAPVVQSS